VSGEAIAKRERRTGLNDRENKQFTAMYYVYLIKSVNFPEIFYVGYTVNLKQRLETHNSGGSIHTEKHRPWELVMYVAFAEQIKAKAFEKYLKSQSGRAFAKKDFGNKLFAVQAVAWLASIVIKVKLFV
jgi:putative endonuclease